MSDSADGRYGSAMCLRRGNLDLIKVSVLIVALKLSKERNVYLCIESSIHAILYFTFSFHYHKVQMHFANWDC